MKLTKIEETNSPLLHRKTFVFSAEFEGPTPKKDDLTKTIVAQLKVKPELVSIKKIQQIFGENKAKVIVNIYNSLEDLKKIEKVKEKKKEKPKKEETPKQEVKEEKIKEENDKETKTKEQEAKPKVDEVQDKQ